MANPKNPPAQAEEGKIVVSSNDEFENMDDSARKASDPYARKPKVEEKILDGGTKVETYS